LILTAVGVAVRPPAGSSPTRPAAGATVVARSSGAPVGEDLGRIVGAGEGGAAASPIARRPVSSPSGVAVPVCRTGDKPARHAGLSQWATTIVDTTYALPDGYRPPDLVPVGRARITGGGLVRSFVIDDLRALSDAAKANGTPLAVQSAYRSRARQASVYAGWVAQSGEIAASKYSARPGHSEHQLGTSLDLRAVGGSAPWSGPFGATPAGRWLRDHAAEFGFILSYPAGMKSVTCYGAEAWHIRYVGRKEAAAVRASGLTLREWLWTRSGG
jgi:D-alanyl-D-alanine carboxypeptidase